MENGERLALDRAYSSFYRDFDPKEVLHLLKAKGALREGDVERIKVRCFFSYSANDFFLETTVVCWQQCVITPLCYLNDWRGLFNPMWVIFLTANFRKYMANE